MSQVAISLKRCGVGVRPEGCGLETGREGGRRCRVSEGSAFPSILLFIPSPFFYLPNNVRPYFPHHYHHMSLVASRMGEGGGVGVEEKQTEDD